MIQYISTSATIPRQEEGGPLRIGAEIGTRQSKVPNDLIELEDGGGSILGVAL